MITESFLAGKTLKISSQSLSFDISGGSVRQRKIPDSTVSVHNNTDLMDDESITKMSAHNATDELENNLLLPLSNSDLTDDNVSEITADNNVMKNDLLPTHASKPFWKLVLTTRNIIIATTLERIIFFFFGLYQDKHMEMRYTDIDYFVFTDAARFMAEGGSPYDRATYRYTPLLAWLLQPTVWWFFSFGKLLFAIGDIITGYLILQIFKIKKVPEHKAVLFSLVWLVNPMVCIISTRGSSEGLLACIIMSFVWAVYAKRIALAGIVAGVAVHFKIYPIIYIPAVIWSLDNRPSIVNLDSNNFVIKFINKDRLIFVISSAISFLFLTGVMYLIYGYPFLLHTYLHHLSRIDHRHNFSPYSTILYMSSSPPGQFLDSVSPHIVIPLINVTLPLPELSSWAFLPQLLLSGVILPIVFAKRDLMKTMFLQTFAFVTFNKVCTSQYFMWYMVFLPFYLSNSTLLDKGKRWV
ncbi:hypothetical protein NADFUDRAFT_82369, partial [Nadsonia fulvescens var. elongata DSM 6958]